MDAASEVHFGVGSSTKAHANYFPPEYGLPGHVRLAEPHGERHARSLKRGPGEACSTANRVSYYDLSP